MSPKFTMSSKPYTSMAKMRKTDSHKCWQGYGATGTCTRCWWEGALVPWLCHRDVVVHSYPGEMSAPTHRLPINGFKSFATVAQSTQSHTRTFPRCQRVWLLSPSGDGKTGFCSGDTQGQADTSLRKEASRCKSPDLSLTPA